MSTSTTTHLSRSDDSVEKELRRYVGQVIASELARRKQTPRPGRPLTLPLTRKGLGRS